MTAYVALLRAINVGGRKLVMKDLAAIGTRLGFGACRTFIASGNLLFTSDEKEGRVKKKLEDALREHMGAEVPIMVRTADEMGAVAVANPFSDKPGNRVVATFLDDPPPTDALAHAAGVREERMELGEREIYIFYGNGMADTKLRIPAAAKGTARNMNTVAKLAELAREME
jgi:uncharacterized protein (DUF1697 family)